MFFSSKDAYDAPAICYMLFLDLQSYYDAPLFDKDEIISYHYRLTRYCQHFPKDRRIFHDQYLKYWL